MASRFTKPDPQIKKNVLRSRAEARKRKRAHASVVGASIAATLAAWAMFINHDAMVMEAAQAAKSSQAAVSIMTSAQDSERQARNLDTEQASATQVPISPAIARSPR